MKEAKGVQIGAQFSIRAAACLDDRQEFDTLDDLINFPESSLPPIIQAVVKDTGMVYTYNAYNVENPDNPDLKKWREGGLGGGSSDSYSKAELNTILGVNPDTGEIGTNITFLEEVVGKDAVIDDSNPDAPVEIEPATGLKKEIADLKEQVENIDGGNAKGVDYNNTYGYTNVEDALNDILEKMNYTAPAITSFTMTPNNTVYEIGSSVSSIVFDWALNKDVTSISLTDCTVTINDRTATYQSTVSNDKTFTLTVGDGKNTASSSKTISFVPRLYYGGAEQPASYDDAFILSLPDSKLASKSSGKYTIIADGTKYGYLAVPVSFGKPTVLISGFETELDLVATINHINSSGYAQQYNIYQGYQGLGEYEMTIQ